MTHYSAIRCLNDQALIPSFIVLIPIHSLGLPIVERRVRLSFMLSHTLPAWELRTQRRLTISKAFQ